MNYQKLFDPQPLFQDLRTAKEKSGLGLGDRRDGKVYRYTDDIVLAVNVALATGRPLLVRGPSGSGKSSLAFSLARILNRRYYEFVVTSRTQAQDLLWRFDAVRRLGDAQVLRSAPAGAGEGAQPAAAPALAWHSYYPYIEPGILWWVLQRDTAARRGYPGPTLPFAPAADPAVFTPAPEAGGPVVLIDEIDKADPDFANNLLVPFGSLQFKVEEIGHTVALAQAAALSADERARQRPVLIITTNEERRLPQAFLRRCIALELEGPGRDGLIEIAERLFGVRSKTLYGRVADAMAALVRERLSVEGEALDETARIHINVAQFLDAVQACLRLKNVAGDEKLFDKVIAMTSWKEEGAA